MEISPEMQEILRQERTAFREIERLVERIELLEWQIKTLQARLYLNGLPYEVSEKSNEQQT